MRWLYLTLTWLFIGLAILGVWLPILPTTPFLLLATACAAKSSPRIHARLLADRIFGPILRDWQREGAVSRRSQLAASLSMAVGYAVVWWRVPSPGLRFVVALTLLAVALYLWSRPQPSSPAA